jgi:hypothetical protein
VEADEQCRRNGSDFKGHLRGDGREGFPPLSSAI